MPLLCFCTLHMCGAEFDNECLMMLQSAQVEEVHHMAMSPSSYLNASGSRTPTVQQAGTIHIGVMDWIQQ